VELTATRVNTNGIPSSVTGILAAYEGGARLSGVDVGGVFDLASLTAVGASQTVTLTADLAGLTAPSVSLFIWNMDNLAPSGGKQEITIP
jgi:hypothetical protein